MVAEHSFDVVSKIDLQEVQNALQQTTKEIQQRFDLKATRSSVTLEQYELVAVSDDDYKLKSVLDILQSKLVKRGVSLKALSYGKVEPAAGGTVRQRIALQQGIPSEKAKEIVKLIKGTKYKVHATIQEDQVRVSGKNKDDLQGVIQLLRGEDLGIHMEFTNYR
jgi:uncharacterized protein YajQ (UPF0234 family)